MASTGSRVPPIQAEAEPAASIWVKGLMGLQVRRRRVVRALTRGSSILLGGCLAAALVSSCRIAPRTIAEDYRLASNEFTQGSLDKAADLAKQGIERAGSDPEWRWKFRLLAGETLLAARKSSDAAAILTPPNETVPAPVLGIRQALLAEARYRTSRRDEARSLLDEARRIALTGNDRRLALQVKLREYYLNDVTEEKARIVQELLSEAKSLNDRRMETLALIDTGFLRGNAYRFDEALPYFQRAEKIAAAEGFKRLRGLALGNIGWCQLNLGESDSAIGNLREAGALARSTGDRTRVGIWANNIGNWHYRRGEYAESGEEFKKAAAIAEETGDSGGLARALGNVAEAATRVDDLTGAESALSRMQASVQLMARSAKSVTFERFLAGRVASRRKEDPEALKAFEETVRLATEHHHPSMLWSAHHELAQLHARNNRAAQADIHYRAALATVDREWSQFSDDLMRVGFMSSLIELHQGYVEYLVAQGANERALEVAEASRARVLARRLDLPAVQTTPTAARLRTLAAASKTVLLSFWTAPKRSFLWVIAPDGITRYDLPPRNEITALAARYNAAITAGHDPIDRGNPHGAALFDMLLGKAALAIPRGAAVIAAVDGGLHRLNLETLVVSSPKPHYWIEDVTLAVAPSLSGLDRAARAPGLGADANLLFIGDPLSPDPRYPTLTHLGRERHVVESHFATSHRTVYTQAAAQPAVYSKSEPGRFSHLHFAAHAVPNDDEPLYSSVILSGTQDRYRLFAHDVLNQPLKASLVVLSACHGAGTRAYSGEGLLGFSWAFLSSGARNVVAGLWQVDDEATVDLMKRLYDGLREGKDPTSALRAAKLTLRHSGKAGARSPYFWGSFQLFTRDLWPPAVRPAAPLARRPVIATEAAATAGQ